MIDPSLVNAYSELDVGALARWCSSANTDLSVSRGKGRFLSDGVIPTNRFAVSGRGAVVMTNLGPLIDFSSMTLNCVLGQNDPWVKINQIGYLLSDRPSFHTTKLGSELYYALPRRLKDLNIAGIADPAISHRQCNGSDVTELALKAAWEQRGGRRRVISFRGSYHGQNLTAYASSDLQRSHVFLSPEPRSVVLIDGPDDQPSLSQLSSNEEGMLTRLRTLAGDVFAVMLEPIQVNNGVRVFSRPFLRELREFCTAHEICLIFDEVQTGFGWLGSLTAAEKYEIVPNIAVFSKGLTGGNGPLAVLVADQRYRQLAHGAATKTQGADLRSLVAANAVLDRLVGMPAHAIPTFVAAKLRRELTAGLLPHVSKRAGVLDDFLGYLREAYPNVIGGLRGETFIRGLTVVGTPDRPSAAVGNEIVEACFRHGLLVRRSCDAIVIKPPIVVADDDLATGFDILEGVLRARARRRNPRRAAKRGRESRVG